MINLKRLSFTWLQGNLINLIQKTSIIKTFKKSYSNFATVLININIVKLKKITIKLK